MEGLAHQDKLGFQARSSEHTCVSLCGSCMVWAARTEAVLLLEMFPATSGAPVSAQEFF